MTSLLDLLDSSATEVVEEVEGRRVRLTSLDRVMWPRVGGTKRDLFRYYVRIADLLLPHVADRPLTLARYPEGVEGKNWFQTMCPHPPEWVTTHPIRARGGESITRNYCVIHDLAGLLWAVNLGSIELHPLLARSRTFDQPDLLAFDLDPGPPASIVDACRVALLVRELLARSDLRAFVKTSGGLGLHVMVPLGTGHTYARTKAFAREVAKRLAAENPERVIDLPERGARAGKVFVDWSQNDANKSIIAAYSMRALPWPAASAPLSWSEVEQAATSGDIDTLLLHANQVVARGGGRDPYAALLEVDQSLP